MSKEDQYDCNNSCQPAKLHEDRMLYMEMYLKDNGGGMALQVLFMVTET
jgi:hypothetical protein